MREHWFDIEIIICPLLIIYLVLSWEGNDPIRNVLILNLVALFIHQFEEYRFPGHFPLMINTVIFKSDEPDRYPLNTHSAFIINVLIGWFSYLIGIFFSDIILIGIIIILASVGNVMAHVLVFNIKGRTIYNPGMISSVVLFLPISILFFHSTISLQLATPFDWAVGIFFSIILSYLSIFKVIDLLKDQNTKYIFND